MSFSYVKLRSRVKPWLAGSDWPGQRAWNGDLCHSHTAMTTVSDTRSESRAYLTPSGTAMLRARTSIPIPVADAVRRPGIERVLDQAAHHRLTLVSAGPGWGKSTATALWAGARPPGTTAWLTCEPQDATPAGLWSDIVGALRSAGAVPVDHPLLRRRPPAHISPDRLRRLLPDLETMPAAVVIVLDDFEVVTGPDVLRMMDDILRYPLPLHFVVLCRSDPALALHRLRARGEIAEIVADDLAFDVTTTVALAAREGITLDKQAATQLLAETGGWAVGVCLRLSSPLSPNGRTQAERSATDFLMAEVLDKQEPRLRQFLLRTSVTTTVSTELAGVLDPGSNAPRMLAYFGARNGFVTRLDLDGTWYQYHPFLREMLRSQLWVEDPTAARIAHRNAARWLAQHGEPIQALDQAAAAKDWALFGEIFVESAGPCLSGSERTALRSTLAQVPFRELAPNPASYLCAAALALTTDRHIAARHHLDRARELLAYRNRPAAASLLELLEGAVARADGEVRRLAVHGAAAEAALARCPLAFPALDAYRALAADQRAIGAAWSGAPVGACPGPDSRAAAAIAAVANGDFSGGGAAARVLLVESVRDGWAEQAPSRAAHAAVAWTALVYGHIDDAELQIARALAADSGERDPTSEATVHLLRSLAAATRRRRQTARLALAAADEALPPSRTPPLLADLRARAWTEYAVLSNAPGQVAITPEAPRPTAAVAAICRARRSLRAGRVSAALNTLTALPRDPETAVLVRVEAAIIEAEALAVGGTRRAHDSVVRALDLAQPDGLALPFLTITTPTLIPIVGAVIAHRSDPLSAVLRSHLSPDSSSVEPAPPGVPLTERELTILGALPSMESNQEIAEDFFVSVNTVKAHLKSLYRKLGVGSRRDAVRRGRELGLIGG